MNSKKNAVNWFELAVTDFDRAKHFYETILGTALTEVPVQGCRMAMFPFDMANGIGGSITLMAEMKPGPGGTLIYLNVEGELDVVISRVAAAGGAVERPRFAIGEHGFIAIIRDTEGNVVGLHSMT
ncbi:MAG: VOC family protein [Verrucomicrobiales bacterium]|nr:VOC family protein [Verrucomicrobiales bacterium]